jgi:ubiquinone/menaquinone biosynthesis C-methylase UbiE
MTKTDSDVPAPLAGCDHYSKSVGPDLWWKAHFDDAADAVIGFFAGDGISLAGKRVADIGCGDGIIDLGVAIKAKPERVVGFDVMTTDIDDLTSRGREHANLDALPENLYFATSDELTLPASDNSFDYVISWSAFEHIGNPVAILKEIRRVLDPHGVLFIQLWPFYHSAHGTHLVDWFPEGFAQFRNTPEQILRTVRSSGSQEMASEMLEVYRTLNGITADKLHAALRQAGFRIVKVALDSEATHIPEEASHIPLSQVAISGIKLLAIQADPDPDADQAIDAEPVMAPVPSAEDIEDSVTTDAEGG